MRTIWFVVAAVSAAALAGCGDVPRGRIHGKVTYQGKPLTDATVIFIAKDNSTHPVPLKPDGSYEVTGIALGPIKVSVQQSAPRMPLKAEPNLNRPGSKADVVDEKASFVPPPTESKVAGPLLPAHYADSEKSGLKFDLTQPDQEWSVDLK